MKWALLGSSNVFNHKHIFMMNDKSVRTDRRVIKCTSIMNFKLGVEGLDKSFECLTVAGLDIALNDLRTSGTDVARYVNSGLSELFEVIDSKAKEGIRVTIGPLIYWSSFDEAFRNLINDAMLQTKIRYPAIHFLPNIDNLKMSQDGVHLDKKSGEKYLTEVIERSLKKWLTPIDEEVSEQEADVNMSQDQGNPAAGNVITGSKRKRGRPSTSTGAGAKPTKARFDDDPLTQINKRLDYLEFSHNKTLAYIAKHEEAIDTAKNEKNLHKVIFSGIEIENLEGNMDTKKPIIIAALKSIVSKFMNEEDIPEIKYVVILNDRIKTTFKVIEARFESAQEARKVREAFGSKIRDWRITKLFPDSLRGVGINLCHTRETRIRIEVMKALAKVVVRNSTSEMEAYVLPYLARPLLKLGYKRPDGNRNIRSYGYTEAVLAITNMHEVTDQDLHQAYSIAGSMPDLEQKFLILRTGFNSVKGWKGQGVAIPTDGEPGDKRQKQ